MVRTGTAHAFVTDNLGSVTTLISACGCTSAPTPTTPTATRPANRQPGQQQPARATPPPSPTAPATSYLHLGSRWYDPATGAFTTQDANAYLNSPANGNRYAYAADNPARQTQPRQQHRPHRP
jgi:RHS repeat-associated protein